MTSFMDLESDIYDISRIAAAIDALAERIETPEGEAISMLAGQLDELGKRAKSTYVSALESHK